MNRKPDELHILNGTFRRDRHGDPAAAVVATGSPSPPPHLKGEALAFWREIVPGLIESGVAKAIDAAALAMLCEWQVRYRTLSEKWELTGDAKLLVPLAICQDKFDRIAARFGLSPVDRSRLRTPPGPKPSGVASRKRS